MTYQMLRIDKKMIIGSVISTQTFKVPNFDIWNWAGEKGQISKAKNTVMKGNI